MTYTYDYAPLRILCLITFALKYSFFYSCQVSARKLTAENTKPFRLYT